MEYINKAKVYTYLIVLMLNILSSNAQNILSEFSYEEGDTIVISKQVDLRGEKLNLPKNIILKFEKGGCLKNGTIIANNAFIIGCKNEIFDSIKVAGQWNVKYISTDMFKDITSLNSLQNVFALASEKVNNVITVAEGNYEVAASHNGNTILSVPSNTEVIINGTITMIPNDYTNYYIVGLKGENIQLHGKGEIVGDKHTHIGTKGEWGMGVNLANCKNVDIYDLTIRDCWGDCIYIGTKSTNVRINNCTLDHGRRQGISITSAGTVLIENCVISNVGGTAPEYAIDVEPNKNDTVDSVIIRNVKSIDCKGGFLTWGGAKNCVIKNVELYDCYVEGASKPDYAFNTSYSIKVINCASNRDYKPINNKCKSFKVEK